MKTTVEKLSPTRVKLNISVTPEELKPSIAHAYEHIGSQVNIPGFRKGKIPPQLIDQRVGREEVLNHAVSDGLDKFYRQAVTEEKIACSVARGRHHHLARSRTSAATSRSVSRWMCARVHPAGL